MHQVNLGDTTIDITIYLEDMTIFQVDLADTTIYLVIYNDLHCIPGYNDTYLPGRSFREDLHDLCGLYDLVHVVEWKPDTCMMFKHVLPGLHA